MRFYHNAGLSKAIVDVIGGKNADIAVAFWGDGACERLCIPDDAAGFRIVCDARSGACNPKEIEALLNRGAAVVDVRGMHAKVYIGKRGVVVSSANASTNGLCEEAGELATRVEAGYLTQLSEDIESARQWFEVLFASGNRLGRDDLPELRKLWATRRKSRVIRIGKESFLEALKNIPDMFKDRRFKVVVYSYDNDPGNEIEEKYKNTKYFDKTKYESSKYYPFFYEAEGWKLEDDDLVLCFAQYDDESIECEGVWRVQEVFERGALVPLKLIEKPFGLRFPTAEKRELERLVVSLLGKPDGIQLDRAPTSISNFVSLLKSIAFESPGTTQV